MFILVFSPVTVHWIFLWSCHLRAEILIVNAFLCVMCRWRNSFLFSLIFGIPVMIVMIFAMVKMASDTCEADNGDGITSDVSAATVSAITAAESNEKCGSRSQMLLPGLSLENLLLFLLCTPCQVSLPFH